MAGVMGGTAGAGRRARVAVGALALVVSVLGAGLRLAASSAAVTVKTYYVNPTTGNDANSGLAGAPWKTYHQMLVKIGDGTVTAGDTVLMAPGFYRVYDSGGWRAPDPGPTPGPPPRRTPPHPPTAPAA